MKSEKRLIDANAAIKEMNAVEIHFWEDAEDGVEKCVNLLHNAPAVDAVEVVHERWVKDGDWLVCLNCESEINVKNSLGIENRRNYCPNCGAKMDGGDEDV